MSQFYTLEEAASKLNMSVDELRELAKKREVRSFQDRGVLRFKSEDIDARLSAPSGVNPETDSDIHPKLLQTGVESTIRA